MLKQRADRTVRTKSQSEQDAESKRWKENRDKQNSLPPETLSGGAARNVCRNGRAHGDNDQHGNAGEQKRDADGCQRCAAYVGAPLPWANASKQRGEWIQQ